MSRSQLNSYGRALDLVCVGRGIVDFYCDQIGGRLEDAVSFSTYVGGSASNICIGAARLGLRTSMLLRVGDDHMGRLIRETMAHNGVDVTYVTADRKHPTPSCVLGVRDRNTFPRDLFTHDGAYLHLRREHVAPLDFERARAVLVNGTFFSTAQLRGVSEEILKRAETADCYRILDIDYRPALWGLVSHGEGEQAYVESASVTRQLKAFMPRFDLIVGTAEEIRVAGGAEETLEAVKRIRRISDATVIVKRGPLGCTTFTGAIPARLDDGATVPGFPVSVMNTAGAGDGYMAGLLGGLLRDQSLERSCRIANACGALVVSRHGCSDASPTWEEVELFLRHHSETDGATESELFHLHWSTTRRNVPSSTTALDLTNQSGRAAKFDGVTDDECHRFLLAALSACIEAQVVDGFLAPPGWDADVLAAFTGRGLWLGRTVAHREGEHPFTAAADAALELRSWPRDHVVHLSLPKSWSSDFPRWLDYLKGMVRIAHTTRHQVLLDLSAMARPDAHLVREILGDGVRPDWWAVSASADLEAFQELVREADPYARGYLVRWSAGHPSQTNQPGRCSDELIPASDALRPVARAWLAGISQPSELAAVVRETWSETISMARH